MVNVFERWCYRGTLHILWTEHQPMSRCLTRTAQHSFSLIDRQLAFHGHLESRRVARWGQGGRLTTLNFRPGAVTTLNLGHVSMFLSSNISHKQTRQYRKSTKEATSGKRCKRKGETNNCSKKQLVGLIMQAAISAHCKNFTGSRAYVASFIRQSRHDITGHIVSRLQKRFTL